MDAIEFDNVTKDYGRAMPLRDFSARIPEGVFAAVLGPSGAGKTTLLRLAAGLERPSAGTIRLFGEDAASLAPHRRGVGMAFQDFALWPHRTVHGHLKFMLGGAKLTRAQRDERIAHLLDVVCLGEVAGAYPATLSGGQQQRLSIARALAREPRVLLLDEPFANLDDALRERILSEIARRVCEENVTVLCATHAPEEAGGAVDMRIVVG
jgi:ABC-type Fe3+/spermidine/putrescine transport system ATPase subunit